MSCDQVLAFVAENLQLVVVVVFPSIVAYVTVRVSGTSARTCPACRAGRPPSRSCEVPDESVPPKPIDSPVLIARTIELRSGSLAGCDGEIRLVIRGGATCVVDGDTIHIDCRAAAMEVR